MWNVSLVLLCAGVLLAQEPAPPKDPLNHPQPVFTLRFAPQKATPAPPPKLCAIPLLMVKPAPTEPMPQIKPPGASYFFLRPVHPLAPACEALHK